MRKSHFLLTAAVAIATFFSLHALAGHHLPGYFGGRPGFLGRHHERWNRPFRARFEAEAPISAPATESAPPQAPVATPPKLATPPVAPADSLTSGQ